jgi:hypothetical protein
MQRGYRGVAGAPVKPYVEFSIYQGSTCYLNLKFLDSKKNPATPAAVTYRIDELTTDNLVLSDTYATVTGSTLQITIPGSLNTINCNVGQSSQINQVTVTALFADGSTTQTVHVYEVIAIQTVGGGTSPILG